MSIFDNAYIEGRTLHAAIGLAQSLAAIKRYGMYRGLGQHDRQPSHRVQVLAKNWWSSLPLPRQLKVNQVSYRHGFLLQPTVCISVN
jgi:hypothetical protein